MTSYVQSTNKFFLSLLWVISICCTQSALATDKHDVFGLFLTQERNSVIDVSECGDSVCGRVVWLNPDALEDGETPEQATSKSGEKILGLTMLQGFARTSSDWRDGTIYDPGKDKTYASRLKRLADGSLEVKGCIAFFCQTQIWQAVKSLDHPLMGNQEVMP